MNTLWCFGDSFTFGHGCRLDCPAKLGYYETYKKDGDAIWPNHLANKLNMNVFNFGKNGASNDWILDSIIDNFDKIQKGDVVSINQTFHQRFDVADNDTNVLKSVHAELPKTIKEGNWIKAFMGLSGNFYKTDIEMETLINYTLLFSQNELFDSRYTKRFKFINNLFKSKNISSVLWKTNEGICDMKLERIYQSTNGKINDGHFSFDSHRNFSEILFKLLENDGKTIH